MLQVGIADRACLNGAGFQWAPTLGGECYGGEFPALHRMEVKQFQWAPTLGGECYLRRNGSRPLPRRIYRFNGHPPLGVNATYDFFFGLELLNSIKFQWAPTLGGECYFPA